MKVLFSLRNFWYVKIFESAILELAARGHEIRLVADERGPSGGSDAWHEAAERLAASSRRVSWRYFERDTTGAWATLASQLRLSGDYLRFLDPIYDAAPRLRARAEERAPRLTRVLGDRWPFRTSGGRQLLRRSLAAAERAVPDDEAVSRLLDEEQPDLVMVSPLVSLGSPQFDIQRTARRRGLRTVFAVGSWDHLSSKALVRDLPDLVLVWNDTQRDEARRFHRIPDDRIVVTGAQCFDQWFNRSASRDAADFRSAAGLDPRQPFLLWVCSALFDGSPSEAQFVTRWIRTVRHHPELTDLGLLIRPHPKRAHEWAGVDLSIYPNVSLWPRGADAPFDAAAKHDYFDSLHHASAVAGLNTSALLEAGIAGRPVHTVLLPEFEDNQRGTLHFRYLLEIGGGLLRVASSLEDHVAQLAASIRDPDAAAEQNRRFIEAFIRPHGIGGDATSAFADAVDACGARPARAAPDPWWIRPLRAALAPVARRTRGSVGTERRRRQQAKRAARQLEIDRRVAAKQKRYADELAAREQRVAREHAENAARIAARRQARDASLALKAKARRQAKQKKSRQRLVQRARARLVYLLSRGRQQSS